jgi:hypothetical protein
MEDADLAVDILLGGGKVAGETHREQARSAPVLDSIGALQESPGGLNRICPDCNGFEDLIVCISWIKDS